MEEQKRLGHDDRINIQAAIAKGWTLALLRKLLGADCAGIFRCNLSDNGPEFARFHEIEEWGVRAFFANPYRSTDKAACERNHEFIRCVIPKGRSLDWLTQAKVETLFSHINSYVRGSNENRTPYELMLARFGEGFMEAIGIRRIQGKEGCLKPSLLKEARNGIGRRGHRLQRRTESLQQRRRKTRIRFKSF